MIVRLAGSILLFVLLLFTFPTFASVDLNSRPSDYLGGMVEHGVGLNTSKTVSDTILLMGPWSSGAPYNGQFQNQVGEPAWNGWTSIDLTKTTESHWQVSDYQADNLGFDAPHGPDNMALWCGFMYPACPDGDVDGGYGTDWFEELHYRLPVADLSDSTNITVNFQLNFDAEAGYDGVRWYKSEYNESEGDPNQGYRHDVLLGGRTGQGWNDTINFTAHFSGNDYLNGYIDVMLVGYSDGGWDDSDCDAPSHGLCQIDDLEVLVASGADVAVQTSFLDFESGTNIEPWAAEYDENFVGDFAWVGVSGDLTVCRSNGSPQALFINYGQYASQGVEAAIGNTYRYGYGGYVVEYNGGFAGEDYHLHNAIRSPIMPWPNQNYDGIYWDFDVYAHAERFSNGTGVVHDYHARSTASDNPEDIEYSGFTGYPYGNFWDLSYSRYRVNVTADMVQNRKWVQFELAAYEIGWFWGVDGSDGTPAPYFDNVRVVVYPIVGPALYSRDNQMAQSSFPASGVINYENLGANSVRFDMARNIAPSNDQHLDFGDSIIVNCAPVRTGATLAANPSMFYKVFTNPLFDAFRTSGVVYEGEVVGTANIDSEYNFSFDLPDSNFLFPGDVLHYYFRGVDDLDGDQTVSILPGDTCHFGDAADVFLYDQDYTVRALPTLYSAAVADQPKVLFWNDGGDRGQAEWYHAMNLLSLFTAWDNAGSDEATRYDIYYTKAHRDGVGNGLGGTSTAEILAGYDIILYTCGLESRNTITSQDWTADGGDDIGVLDQWLRQGNKNLFLTGNDLAYNLDWGSSDEGDFLTNWLGLTFEGYSVGYLIGGQITPLIKSVRTVDPQNDIFADVPQWVAYGGCPGYNHFNAVHPTGNAIRLAEFTDQAGQTGQYSYSAATLNLVENYNAKIISLPYAFRYIYDSHGDTNKFPTRALLLDAVLQYFGLEYEWPNIIDVPPVQVFTASNYPNPFNPNTRIDFNMPKTAHLNLKVYNVRGELVRTLVDGKREVGPGFAMWDGTNNRGTDVSSGVYFYEARTSGDVLVNKMMLVR